MSSKKSPSNEKTKSPGISLPIGHGSTQWALSPMPKGLSTLLKALHCTKYEFNLVREKSLYTMKDFVDFALTTPEIHVLREPMCNITDEYHTFMMKMYTIGHFAEETRWAIYKQHPDRDSTFLSLEQFVYQAIGNIN